MSTLPHEVLLLIFKYLSRDDLLEFQYTCKQWRKASSVLLYTNIDLKSELDAEFYAETVSEFPELGRYLKNIHFHNVFDQTTEDVLIENHNILDTIIKHCPNITSIENTDKNKYFPFWTQLMYAATLGHLSNLKCLPQPYNIDLRSYIYTALLFTNSLEQLSLNDKKFSFGPDLYRLGAFQTLCDQIDQFKNLRYLTLAFFTEEVLSYFDELIDKCHHLKELTLDLLISRVVRPDEPALVIHPRPRPDIDTFTCGWDMLVVENQLEYVMCKFPSLKKLIVTFAPDVDEDEAHNLALTKLIQYALTIPDFRITININDENLLRVWAELMKKKQSPKSLAIVYHEVKRSRNTIILSSESTTQILFAVNTGNSYNGRGPPHIRLFSEVGRTIRSLLVNVSDGIPDINGRTSTTMEWLFDILQRCPFIEEITILYPSRLSSILHTLKYPSVKKLDINLKDPSIPINFLDCLSFSLPNLHRLSFQAGYTEQHCTEPIAIHMPHTSLDLLTWTETEDNHEIFRSTMIFIKLKTDAGTEFYLGVRNMLSPIDSECYYANVKNIRFDISCKQLKELRIRKDGLSEFVANFAF